MFVEPADYGSTHRAQQRRAIGKWSRNSLAPFSAYSLLQTISDDDRVIMKHNLQLHPKSS